MANHLRRRIREAVAGAITGLATTGSRVYQSRVYPLEDADLPALRVTTLGETIDGWSVSAPRVQERHLRVSVEIVARAVADLDDTLDQAAKEVEVALAMPCAALAGIAKSITLQSTDIELDGASQRPTGHAAMVFDVFYMTAENAPDVAL